MVHSLATEYTLKGRSLSVVRDNGLLGKYAIGSTMCQHGWDVGRSRGLNEGTAGT